MRYLLAILLLLPACKSAPKPAAVNPSAIIECSYNDTEHCGQYQKASRQR